jgi:hypothetical protein
MRYALYPILHYIPRQLIEALLGWGLQQLGTGLKAEGLGDDSDFLKPLTALLPAAIAWSSPA